MKANRFDKTIHSDLFLIVLAQHLYQALYKAKAIDSHNSQLFTRIVDFVLKKTPDGDCPAAVREVISSQTKAILGGKTVSEFVSDARSKVVGDALSSLDTRIAVAKCLLLTGAGTSSDAASLIVDGGVRVRKANIENCREALKCLTDLGVEEAKSKWISLVKERFPLAKGFDH